MNKKIVIILPVVFLLVGAFVAKTMFMKPPPPDTKALAKKPGPIYTMKDPFVVNLSDGDNSHFAKVGVALRLSELSAPDLEPAKGTNPASMEADPELRDIVISTLQKHSSAELSTAAGREDVKKQIIDTVNKETDEKIVAVYYTEFAVQ